MFLEVLGRLFFVCLFVCFICFFFLYLSPEYENCAQLYKSDKKISGVYKINPDGAGPDFEVFSDQKLPEGDGKWSKRGWMALWISTATGLTTRMALVTLMASFDSDWKNRHRLTNPRASFGSIWL